MREKTVDTVADTARRMNDYGDANTDATAK